MGLAADPRAVEPVRLDSGALHVRIIDVDGSREATLAVPEPLPHPHCLGGTLQKMLRFGCP